MASEFYEYWLYEEIQYKIANNYEERECLMQFVFVDNLLVPVFCI